MSRGAFWESSRREELLGVWKTSFILVLLAAFWELLQVVLDEQVLFSSENLGKRFGRNNNNTLAKSLAGEDRQAWRKKIVVVVVKFIMCRLLFV